MTSVAGAVLTGGRSSRMGQDKATMIVTGLAMVERVGGALAAGGCDPVLGVGPPERAGTLGHVADRDPGEGPLGGILTALAAAPPTCEWVLVAACDLPWLDPETVRVIIAADRAAMDVVVARTGHIEPLCALWRVDVAPELQRLFDGGERAVHRALASLAVLPVDVDPAALRNVNAPHDLDL